MTSPSKICVCECVSIEVSVEVHFLIQRPDMASSAMTATGQLWEYLLSTRSACLRTVERWIQRGADLNFRPRYGRLTMVEYVCQTQPAEVVEAFVRNSRVNLEARPGRILSCPLAFIMARENTRRSHGEPVPTSTMLHVLSRMELAVDAACPQDSLLVCAIKYSRTAVALELIERGAHVNVRGLFQWCVSYRCVDVVHALLAKGHRDTERYFVRGLTLTAVDYALAFREREIAGLLLPVSKMTMATVWRLAQYGMVPELVYVLCHCNLRSIRRSDMTYLMTWGHHECSAIVKELRALVYTGWTHFYHIPAIKDPLHRRMLIAAWLRAGVPPTELIRPYLPEALKPWSTLTHREYFPPELTKDVVSVLLASVCREASRSHVPLELFYVIISFLARIVVVAGNV